MTETPVVIQSEGEQVIGYLHRPDGDGPFPAVMFCHGFTGYSGEKFRLFVHIARALAAQGILSLRFDFRGHGNSAGSSADATIEGEWADAEAVLSFLNQQADADSSRTGIVGMSMGGMVAAHMLGKHQGFKAGVLLCPVSDGASAALRKGWGEQRELLDRQGYLDLGGWLTSKDFVEQLAEIKTADEIAATNAPVLLIHGDADDVVPPSDSLAYQSSLQSAGKQVELRWIQGANHTFESEAWHKEVTEHCLGWFKQHLECC